MSAEYSSDDRIRVLQIMEATIGGTRRHLHYLLSHLDQTKFSISLIYDNQRDIHFREDLSLFEKININLIHVPMTRSLSPLRDFVSFVRILSIIRQGRYDVVHVHSSKAGFLGRLSAAICGIPNIIYSPHGFAFQYIPNTLVGSVYRWLERLAAPWRHTLVCVSEGEQEVAKRYRLSSASDTRVIPNTIPAESLAPTELPSVSKHLLGIPASSLVVGMVAHFRPQKGIRHSIDAIPKVLQCCPETRFVIVGDGPLLPETQDHIISLGIDDRVTLTGHSENVVDYYQIMDVFILSSLWEGMPYVLLEAMAMGLPLIATDSPGNNELVVHEENGFLVPLADDTAIAERVIQVLLDNQLRERFGKKSRQMAEGRISMIDWIHQYEELYESRIGATKSKRITGP